jgi:hypothetical protein
MMTFQKEENSDHEEKEQLKEQLNARKDEAEMQSPVEKDAEKQEQAGNMPNVKNGERDESQLQRLLK